jgi:hypothetical protein
VEGKSNSRRAKRELRPWREIWEAVSASLEQLWIRNTYIRPSIELCGKPRTIIKQDPENYRNKKWEGDNSGVEEAVQCLQWAWPVVQRGAPSSSVEERVDGGQEEVKCDTPERQAGEVAELAVVDISQAMSSLPSKYEEYRRKGIDGNESA